MTQALNLALLGNSVDASGDLSLTTGVAGTLPVANGGTGRNTLTANNVLLGNGTTAVQQIAPGASGNVLQSNGTTWTSAAVGGYIGGRGEVFTTSGTFTVPAGITAVKVTVVGGGGGGGNATGASSAGGGGGGGVAVEYVTGLTPLGTVTVTVGTGGASAAAGLTSSFGAFCSATGGAAGASSSGGGSAGGNGGAGSGGTYNIAGGVGSNGLYALTVGNAGGAGGGSGAEMTDKSFCTFASLNAGCGTFNNVIVNPNGIIGYFGGKGGNVTAINANASGNAASGYGNGGGGAIRQSTGTPVGGAGTAGIVIVEY